MGTGNYETTRFGWEAVSYRGMVWRAMRRLQNQTNPVHPALNAFRLGDFWGAVSRPWFLLYKAGGHYI